MKPHIKYNLSCFKSHTYLCVYFLKWTWTSPNKCKQKTRGDTHIEYALLKASLFWVWFYIKQLQSLKTLTDCKDTVVVVPERCEKSAILYDTEKIPAWSDCPSCDTSKSI